MKFKTLRNFILVLAIAGSVPVRASLCNFAVLGNDYANLVVKGINEQILNVEEIEKISLSPVFIRRLIDGI